MTTNNNTIDDFSTLIDHCIQIFENSETELGRATASKLKLVPLLQSELEIQRPDLPFDEVLGAMGASDFQQSISQIMHYFPWRFRDGGDWTLFTPNAPFDLAKFSWIELVGPEGIADASDLSMGLYWQGADTFYPMHRHNAEEFYHVLSGNALWYCDSTGEEIRKPGTSFVHTSLEDHSTTTKAEPILALWAWRGDLGSDSYSKDPV